MTLVWNHEQGAIFTILVEEFKKQNIRYFVLRNYDGLPDENTSKDVDIIIEPGKLKKSREILKNVYKRAGLKRYSETIYGRVHCMLGMNEDAKFSIHIDLIEGYLAKGFEVFKFDELYSHTKWYRGFCVMDSLYEGIMLYIYKQFGYAKPKFKEEYKDSIYQTYQTYSIEFFEVLTRLLGKDFAMETCKYIANKDFDSIINNSQKLTKSLQNYVWKKHPFDTLKNVLLFFFQKVTRVVFQYKKHAKVLAVLAPDGTGKTTFLDTLIKQLQYYYVNTPEDNRFSVYHFRPTILPNLGEVGEKVGVMKQNTDFTNPHRSKPANLLSSLLRITYYTIDYIIGWQKCVRRDVQFDKYTIFDRYSYDFIVDPLRTKLNLPKWVRRFFVALTPKPEVIFVLNAQPEVIYARKQELTLREITRQVGEYQKITKKNPQRFVTINATKTPNQMAEEAVKILLNKYTVRL